MTRLNGVGVLITRPADRAGPLIDAVKAAGGRPMAFPVLEIELQASSTLLQPDGSPLEPDALVIFVSVYAVRALQSLPRTSAQLPPQGLVAAIGQATAQALRNLDLSVDLMPQDEEDSEGLLRELESLPLTDRQVLILRGQSGRELLSRELTRRGARVTQVQCYRRRPVASPPMASFRRWLSLPDGVVTVTSVAILEALLDAVTAQQRRELMGRPVVTLSERISEACRQSGFTGPIGVAQGTAPENICEAILNVKGGTDTG